ncbi:hypothetical protein KVV02_007237 [Mortierella alpina]|uniref:Uncharacterized protein n=1 Tax=Mortierella alpina TaxID=64518 RepID=A0A9P8A2R5_MORAP|nr:hypothetical protein KVV02_007237 [Mortierella alpina]
MKAPAPAAHCRPPRAGTARTSTDKGRHESAPGMEPHPSTPSTTTPRSRPAAERTALPAMASSDRDWPSPTISRLEPPPPKQQMPPPDTTQAPNDMLTEPRTQAPLSSGGIAATAARHSSAQSSSEITPTTASTPILANMPATAKAPPSPPEAAKPPGEPVAAPEAVAETSETVDPLSHLSHIFDKIRRQVVEWGEDANWKIDVFLLPTEDGAPPPGLPIPNSPIPPPLVKADLAPSPRRSFMDSKEPNMDHGNMFGPVSAFTMEKRCHLLMAIFVPESVPPALRDSDIQSMNEVEAKRLLSLACRQIREQQESLAQLSRDLDALRRMSAKRERDAESRLEVERRIMERDAMVLSRKWKETSLSLIEKDREIRDVQSHLESGKRLIRERNEERRRRIDEKQPARDGPVIVHTPSGPNDTRPSHQHRHRHIHYHRHHHRHLTKHGSNVYLTEGDPLDNLAMLASQVLLREPLIITKKSIDPVDPPDENANEDSTAKLNETARSEKRQIETDEKDVGLQLRPVKRQELLPSRSVSESLPASDRQFSREAESGSKGRTGVSNGKAGAESSRRSEPITEPVRSFKELALAGASGMRSSATAKAAAAGQSAGSGRSRRL